MEEKTVAVLGLGLFGVSVARTLAKKGNEVIAMDKNMNHVEEVSSCVTNAIQGDFTKIEHLEAAHVDSADVAIVATGELLEVSIMTIFHLKKLGVPRIIVKTKSRVYKDVLLKVGADQVVLPEIESGKQLARSLSDAPLNELLALDDDHHIIEADVLEEWIGKTLVELNVRENYGLNVLGVKTKGENTYHCIIEPTYVFKHDDRMIVLSENEEINSEAEDNESDED